MKSYVGMKNGKKLGFILSHESRNLLLALCIMHLCENTGQLLSAIAALDVVVVKRHYICVNDSH